MRVTGLGGGLTYDSLDRGESSILMRVVSCNSFLGTSNEKILIRHNPERVPEIPNSKNFCNSLQYLLLKGNNIVPSSDREIYSGAWDSFGRGRNPNCKSLIEVLGEISSSKASLVGCVGRMRSHDLMFLL